MDADMERAILSAYQCYIDACFEHDCDHARRAAQVLRDLIPEPRRATDVPPEHPDGSSSQMNAAQD